MFQGTCLMLRAYNPSSTSLNKVDRTITLSSGIFTIRFLFTAPSSLHLFFGQAAMVLLHRSGFRIRSNSKQRKANSGNSLVPFGACQDMKFTNHWQWAGWISPGGTFFFFFQLKFWKLFVLSRWIHSGGLTCPDRVLRWHTNMSC